jgi:phosphatidylinositol 4-kinase
MKRMIEIYKEANLNIYLRPYEMFITASNSGMIEFIPDTTSIDSLKKKFPVKKGSKPWTLRNYFDRYYGGKGPTFEEA